MTTRSSSRATSSAGTPRFDTKALRKAAGAKVFERGVEYYEDGQVEIVSIERSYVVANVFGTETYRAELDGAGGVLSGFCTCPAYAEMGFCKHLVATALTANDPKAADAAMNRYARLHGSLRKMNADALADLIVDLAKRDTALLKELELTVALGGADDETLFEHLANAVTDATATRGYIEYREASSWAKGIEAVLRRIEKLIDDGRPTLVLRLMDRLFDRLEAAAGSIDDSDGHLGAVYWQASEIYHAACDAARPDPVQLARTLFERELHSYGDEFYAASEVYADILGDTGLTEYERLAKEAWAKIKPIQGGDRRIHDDQSSMRRQVGAILERIAERKGDVDARIAIRAKDLSSAHAYFEVARICLDAGRETDALHWAEEGLWKFEDQHDRLLVVFTADLYRQMGRQQDADKLLWTTFSNEPTLHLYENIKAIETGNPAAAKAVYDRAVEVLKERIAKAGKRHAYFEHPAFLLVQILIGGQDFAEAWKIVHEYELSPFLVEELAEASAATHPADALRAYERLAEDRIRTGQGNYAEAAKLIARMRDIREGLGERAPHLAYVRGLMERHKAKRNFMKLMRAEGYADPSGP